MNGQERHEEASTVETRIKTAFSSHTEQGRKMSRNKKINDTRVDVF